MVGGEGRRGTRARAASSVMPLAVEPPLFIPFSRQPFESKKSSGLITVEAFDSKESGSRSLRSFPPSSCAAGGASPQGQLPGGARCSRTSARS